MKEMNEFIFHARAGQVLYMNYKLRRNYAAQQLEEEHKSKSVCEKIRLRAFLCKTSSQTSE